MHENDKPKLSLPPKKNASFVDENMVTVEDESGKEIQIPASVAQAEALFRIADAVEGIFSLLSSGVATIQPQEPQKCQE